MFNYFYKNIKIFINFTNIFLFFVKFIYNENLKKYFIFKEYFFNFIKMNINKNKKNLTYYLLTLFIY